MKKIVLLPLLMLAVISCGRRGEAVLFDGNDISKWAVSGKASVGESMFVLSGQGAGAVLKKGDYGDFVLSMEMMTTPGGKGEVWFHTDPQLSKGYRVAVNNDREDRVWWRMSGSLLSVRNLTKSFVKEEQWFRMDICVAGSSVRISIDGQPVVEYFEPALPYRTKENAGMRLSQGTFAIKSSGNGDIKFRNIAVTLPPSALDARQQRLADIGFQGVDEQKDEIIRLHQEDFPVLDYHVHLKGGLTNEMAAQQSRRTGINYAIAPNCGIGFPITNDAEVMGFLDTMRNKPFILAMQAEGREWVTTFSKEVRNEFDFVFTDALTFTDGKGRRTRLWIPEETWIDNEQRYMDLIVDRICGVLEEPTDIYVNPCFLPAPMNERYDEFWTEERMDRVVDALVKNGVALEINEVYNIPNKAIIQKAKAAGVKFTFGTNNATKEVSDLSYCIRMMRECGITADDMYKPEIKI